MLLDFQFKNSDQIILFSGEKKKYIKQSGINVGVTCFLRRSKIMIKS